MITANLIADTDILDAISDTARKSPKLMATAYRRNVGKVLRAYENELQTEPRAKPDLPFIWSYDPVKQGRARRWYFANRVPPGSEGGRYQRTGQMVAAWKVELNTTDSDGVITASNDAPGNRYVIGDRQVPSHYATGWYEIEEVNARYTQQLEDVLINTWYTVTEAGT